MKAKKLIAKLLSLSMILGLCTAGAMAANADEFKLTLVPTADPAVYSIMLTPGTEGDTINRFTAADLAFEMTQGLGQIDYTVTGNTGECIRLNDSKSGDNRYEFYVHDAANTKSDVSGTSIQLGSVSFSGYGQNAKFKMIDAVVNTTSETDNIVVTKLDEDTVLDVDTSAGTTAAAPTALIDPLTLKPATKNLTINVTFPNAVTNQAADYQAMKVTVSGGDLTTDVVVDLGSTAAITDVTPNVYPYAATAKTTAAWHDAANYVFDQTGAVATNTIAGVPYYEIVLTDILTENVMYSVELSGAGYRTAHYNVLMTDGKTLTFWNNVMDTATVVEKTASALADGSAVQVTYLAGEIVEDAQINIYDLSAVVSYFGTTGLSATNRPEFAKYDLNRDGKIDSIDVAYVLVSWSK